MRHALRIRVSSSVFALSAVLSVALAGAACRKNSGELPPAEPAPPPAQAPAQQEGAWEVLFDGTSLDAWRNFRKEEIVGWGIEAGTLSRTGPGGDIMTKKMYANFELELEWKISEGGNSGIMFRVTEDEDFPWRTGAEMQILDDDKHGDGKNPLTSAGANYALHAVSQKTVKPVGEWNAVRLVVNGDHVEHWLNGIKVVEYTLWDEAWTAAVAKSKFSTMPKYARNKIGHIVLQDHGDPVWFRNVRIRTL